MTGVIIMCGIANSGKSKVAHLLANAIPYSCIISIDDFRNYGSDHVDEEDMDEEDKEQIAINNFLLFFKNRLSAQRYGRIIIDNSWVDLDIILSLIELIKQHSGSYAFISVLPCDDLEKHSRGHWERKTMEDLIKQEQEFQMSRVIFKGALELKNINTITKEEVQSIINSLTFNR